MRFALLGRDPDMVSVARSLLVTGHGLLSVDEAAAKALGPAAAGVRVQSDLEELLSDPALEAVLIGSPLADRPAHLRRALQTEHHVLCAQPAGDSPDIGYEAALIQGDTHRALVSFSAEAAHPAVRRLAELARGESSISLVLVRMPRTADLEEGHRLSALAGWDLLRAIGGDIAEVSAFAADPDPQPQAPLLVSGRYERGGLFHCTYLPVSDSEHVAVELLAGPIQAKTDFPAGLRGASSLRWQRGTEQHTEEQPPWDPGRAGCTALQEAIAAVARGDDRPTAWQDATRALELTEAARRSIERRRASMLEYPEATEETGFKGTMTMLGCGLVWLMLGLLILARWAPAVGWAIIPLLIVFLLLQGLRWVLPRRQQPVEESRTAASRSSGRP